MMRGLSRVIPSLPDPLARNLFSGSSVSRQMGPFSLRHAVKIQDTVASQRVMIGQKLLLTSQWFLNKSRIS